MTCISLVRQCFQLVQQFMASKISTSVQMDSSAFIYARIQTLLSQSSPAFFFKNFDFFPSKQDKMLVKNFSAWDINTAKESEV